jgi:hypothetical protein
VRRGWALNLSFGFMLGGVGAVLVPWAWTNLERLRVVLTPPPIEIIDQRARWLDARTLEVVSDGARWNRTCKVMVSRLLLLVDGTYIGANLKYIAGPMLGVPQDPRYDIEITPQVRASSTALIVLPTWVRSRDVRFFVTNGLVADDKPCTDGWSGQWRMQSVAIPPPPSEADR